MDLDQRPLAETVVDDPPQRAADRVAHNIVIPSSAGWKLLHRPLDAVTQKGLSLSGDRQLLAQMISNLVENALNHTPAGTIVRLTARRGPRGAEIEVADNGPGIPESERDKVFDRFYRLDRSRGTAGSGLGLALVKAIAGLHGLAIRLEDRKPGLSVTVGP